MDSTKDDAQTDNRTDWTLRLAAATQVLAVLPTNFGPQDFKTQAAALLFAVPPPRNQSERLMALALLTAVGLRHLGLDYRIVIRATFGESVLRAFTAAHDVSSMASPHSLAARTREILDRHNSDTVTIKQLARRLQVSRNTLSVEFKRTYGLSIRDYMARRRILRAATMMQRMGGNVGNKSLAAAVGAANSTFYKQFKEIMGTTPAAYARECQALLDVKAHEFNRIRRRNSAT